MVRMSMSVKPLAGVGTPRRGSESFPARSGRPHGVLNGSGGSGVTAEGISSDGSTTPWPVPPPGTGYAAGLLCPFLWDGQDSASAAGDRGRNGCRWGRSSCGPHARKTGKKAEMAQGINRVEKFCPQTVVSARYSVFLLPQGRREERKNAGGKRERLLLRITGKTALKGQGINRVN